MGLLSHPLRVRGLKQYVRYRHLLTVEVAPLAGAWIETIVWKPPSALRLVAPLAGAWIETQPHSRPKPKPRLSHPLRVRGLKQE